MSRLNPGRQHVDSRQNCVVPPSLPGSSQGELLIKLMAEVQEAYKQLGIAFEPGIPEAERQRICDRVLSGKVILPLTTFPFTLANLLCIFSPTKIYSLCVVSQHNA